MQTIEPQLIKCPNCIKDKNNAYLGSVTSQGYFIIKKRSYNEFMMIKAEEYSVICECGYQIHVEYGKITTSKSFASDPMFNG
jgi:hypothetical protein